MRRLPALLVAALMLLTTAACSGDSPEAKEKKKDVEMGDAITGLTVGGTFGAQPEVKVDPAVKVDEPVTQVVSAGDGNPVLANKKAMFNIYLAQGSNGKKLFSSSDQGTPMQVVMKDDQFFPVIIKALVDKPQGSRVAIAATVQDVWGKAGVPQLKLKTSDTVLFVLDVLSVEPVDVDKAPSGTKVDAPATAPVVQESGGKVTGLDFSKSPKKAPTELQVIPLVEGEGAAAKKGRLVTFNYYGAVWGDKKPFDSSFARPAPESFGIGVNGLIKAWDQVIPGLKQGSRVMIIAPPGQAYGARAQQGIPKNSTLAFVIDVLGVDS